MSIVDGAMPYQVLQPPLASASHSRVVLLTCAMSGKLGYARVTARPRWAIQLLEIRTRPHRCLALMS